jgi:hypothetical protein
VLTAAGSPMVAGASTPQMKTVHVKVTRAFLMKGERVEIGTVLEVDQVLCGELCSAGKATIVPKPEVKPEPPKVEPKAKEKANAG